jgi:hypothetical protein
MIHPLTISPYWGLLLLLFCKKHNLAFFYLCFIVCLYFYIVVDLCKGTVRSLPLGAAATCMPLLYLPLDPSTDTTYLLF